MSRTRVLVVDDSALMRRCLKGILEEAGGAFEVKVARNGVEALHMVGEFDPQVVTLDVNMPQMDGLTCLRQLMAKAPRPVIMVSSLTEEGAAVTLDALEAGAVDFVTKPDGTISRNIATLGREIVSKVTAASHARLRRASGLRQRLRQRRISAQAERASRPVARDVSGLVLIGVSTGGPGTLEDILPRLPADFPWPVLVAQHMPGSFTGVFARRIEGLCNIDVVEVVKPTVLSPGTAYIAAGSADVVVERRLGRLVANSVAENPDLLWHPSVDRMVRSAGDVLPPRRIIGVLLTGMGSDGAESMADIRRGGGRTIAESEESAVVFGMPAELIRRQGAEMVLPADEIARQLIRWTANGTQEMEATACR